jgi:flagellar biosynthetic protein FlhB
MAGDDRTEPATPRRRSEARQKGQLARSTQLTSIVVVFAGLLYFRWAGDRFVDQIRTHFNDAFSRQLTNMSHSDLTPTEFYPIAREFGLWLASTVGPPLGVLIVAAIIVNIAQTGLYASLKPLTPDLGRLNFLNGFRRFFSARAVVDLARSLIEIVVVLYYIYLTVESRFGEIWAMPTLELPAAVALMSSIIFDTAINAATVLLLLAFVDYAYQRYSFEKGLRMTKQEVKDEAKQMENPEIRGRIRSRQRDMARQRMMQQVPNASVVITNPTHIAVALRYEPGESRAPKVVAKGQRLIAENIKRLAHEHGIPIYEDKPLARALFASVEIDAEIPPQMYQAVAEVLAFIYQRLPNSALGTQLRTGPGSAPLAPAPAGTPAPPGGNAQQAVR